MRDCERCGGEVSWTSDTVRLSGGVAAHLCTACLREFNDIALASDAYEAETKLVAREAHYNSLATAQQPVSQAEWEALEAERAELKRAFASLAKAFLAEKPAAVRS